MTKSAWYCEFKAEIERDARELLAARDSRLGGAWSFQEAAARTKLFYVERVTGYATCQSITAGERDDLLALVGLLWPSSGEN